MKYHRFSFVAVCLLSSLFSGELASAADPALPPFLHRVQSMVARQTAATQAAASHQELVLAELQKLKSEGYASWKEVAQARTQRDILLEQLQRLHDAGSQLELQSTDEFEAGQQVLIVPLPVLGDFASAEAETHVVFDLYNQKAREAAESISKRIREYHVLQNDAAERAMTERIRRTEELGDNSHVQRQVALLELRRNALNIATLENASWLPTITTRTSPGATSASSVERIIEAQRRINRLKIEMQAAAQTASLQMNNELLARLNDMPGDSVGGRERLTALQRKESLSQHAFHLQQILTASGVTAVETEFNLAAATSGFASMVAEQKLARSNALKNKVSRHAETDSFFAGEAQNFERKRAVAESELAAAAFEQTLLSLAKALQDSRDLDSDAHQAKLKELLETAANDTSRLAVIDAKRTICGHRLAGLKKLADMGLATWWETRRCEADEASLNVQRRQEELRLQIAELCGQVAEHSSPITISESTQVSQVAQPRPE